jgi:chromate transporter
MTRMENPSPSTEGPCHVPLGEIGWSFLRLGTVAFGGLGPTLALIEREWAEGRSSLTGDKVAESLAWSRLLPGSSIVQVVSSVGFRLGGWPGSALATAAFLLPSILAMLGLAMLTGGSAPSLGLDGAVGGLTAAVAGLLLSTTWRLGRKIVRDALSLSLVLGALAAGLGLGGRAVVIVAGAGLIGMVALATPGRKEAKGQ